jgi:hypothetical protein
MKVVGLNHLTSQYGYADVYNTTNVLDSATLGSLVNYSNSTGTFTFSQSTPLLQSLSQGDVIIIPPGTSLLFPNGALRTVLSVQGQGSQVIVETKHASLFEIFAHLHVGAPFPPSNSTSPSASNGLGPTGAPKNLAPQGTIHLFDYTKQLGPFSLTGDRTAGAYVTVSADLWFGSYIDWCCDVEFLEMDLVAHAEAGAYVKGSPGPIDWSDHNIEEIWNSGPLMIIPPVLWMHITVNLEGLATGYLA